MKLRDPKDILHKGVRLSDALEAHGRWLRGEADAERMDWSYADMAGAIMTRVNLAGADMAGADMAGAIMTRVNLTDAKMAGVNMCGTIGNMREIKSAQFDKWPITWTTAPDGEVTLQIGCQQHSLPLWEKSDPRWIEAMDDCAAEWWAKYRDVVLALVKSSPATPYGKEST